LRDGKDEHKVEEQLEPARVTFGWIGIQRQKSMTVSCLHCLGRVSIHKLIAPLWEARDHVDLNTYLM
jgi:hypothetical protein